jgi:hypothetical protein
MRPNPTTDAASPVRRDPPGPPGRAEGQHPLRFRWHVKSVEERRLIPRLERLRRSYLGWHGQVALPGQCHLCGAASEPDPAPALAPAVEHLRRADPGGEWCTVCLHRAFAFSCERCGQKGYAAIELEACPCCGLAALCDRCLPGGSSQPCKDCVRARTLGNLIRRLKRLRRRSAQAAYTLKRRLRRVIDATLA